MTGMHWLAESGLLYYPIALTTTHHAGTVHEALVAYRQENELIDAYGNMKAGISTDLGPD